MLLVLCYQWQCLLPWRWALGWASALRAALAWHCSWRWYVLALLAVFILFADWSIQFILRSAVQLAEPPEALWLRGLVLSLTPAMLCGLFIAMAAGLRRHSGLAPAALSARLLALGGVGAMSAIPVTALPWDGDFERSLLLPVVGVDPRGVGGTSAMVCFVVSEPIGERLSWSSMPSSAEPLPATLLPVVGVAAGAIFCTWRELALLWDAWYGSQRVAHWVLLAGIGAWGSLCLAPKSSTTRTELVVIGWMCHSTQSVVVCSRCAIC